MDDPEDAVPAEPFTMLTISLNTLNIFSITEYNGSKRAENFEKKYFDRLK